MISKSHGPFKNFFKYVIAKEEIDDAMESDISCRTSRI